MRFDDARTRFLVGLQVRLQDMSERELLVQLRSKKANHFLHQIQPHLLRARLQTWDYLQTLTAKARQPRIIGQRHALG